MTPQTLFKKHSLKRWYCLGAFFGPPYHFPRPDGSAGMGCQVLIAADVESQFILGQWAAPRAPGPFTAAEIAAFLAEIFARHGKPTEGVLISCSVWESIEALYFDAVTRERVRDVFQAGMLWPAMPAAERSKIEFYAESLGLRLLWSEEALPESVLPRADGRIN